MEAPPGGGPRGSPLESTCVPRDSAGPQGFPAGSASATQHPISLGLVKTVSHTCSQQAFAPPGPLASLVQKRQVLRSRSPELPGRAQGTSFQRKERGVSLSGLKAGNHGQLPKKGMFSLLLSRG